MGNLIVMAVRHTNLDVLATLDFKGLAGYQTHRSDLFPKEFSEKSTWLCKRDRNYEVLSPDVLFSNYHHYSNSFSLYVDDEVMFSPGHLNYPIACNKAGTPFDFNALVPAVRKAVRRQSFSLLSGKGKINRSVREPGARISFFLLYTDCLMTAEQNPHLMEDVAAYCRDGSIATRTFRSISGGISPIGTIDGDASAILRIFDLSVQIHTLPRFQFLITDLEKRDVVDCLDEAKWSEAADQAELIITRELCAAHGYVFCQKSLK